MSEVHEVGYISLEEEPREGRIARAMNWLSDHPALAGLITGSAAVVIAAANAREGVTNAPAIALAISAVAVLAWIVFFYMASPLLDALAVREVEHERHIEFGESEFRWIDSGETRCDIAHPEYDLYASEVPESALESSKRHEPTSAWLVVSGEGGRFVLETQLTAEEASQYPTASNELIESVDEQLPPTLISDLLNMADRSLEVDTES